MDVSVRELRNHTARVIAAIESGEPVVLTKHGRPVADITPRTTRSEARPLDVVFAELRRIGEQHPVAPGTPPDPAEYETVGELLDRIDRRYR